MQTLVENEESIMILAINYADEKWKPAQKYNSKCALKYGADEVTEYGPELLDKDFKEANKELLSFKRGGGYWVWKPYIILDALNRLEDGDYLFYSDSGLALIKPLSNFLEPLKKSGQNVMCFSTIYPEKYWSKRDAFTLMGCDAAEYYNTLQIMSGISLFKKSIETIALVKEWLYYAQDIRIVTDNPNVMGKENYEGFIENRHDQTVWSLLCKRHHILPFRDPSEYGMEREKWPKDILQRSPYGQIMIFHRQPWLHSDLELFYPGAARLLKFVTYKSIVKDLLRRVLFFDKVH